MQFGLRLNNVRCYGGQVKVVGLDAVVATFSQTTLERRGEDGSGNPIWTLHAVLSYSNEMFLKNDAFEKRIVVEPWKGKEYVAEPYNGAGIKLDAGHLIIEGVTLCLPEQKRP